MARPKTQAEFIKNLKAIYASFDKKDLTEAEFIRQMLELNDPKKIMEDLDDATLRLARERLNRMRIGGAIKNG